jgi:hypothetical protein
VIWLLEVGIGRDVCTFASEPIYVDDKLFRGGLEVQEYAAEARAEGFHEPPGARVQLASWPELARIVEDGHRLIGSPAVLSTVEGDVVTRVVAGFVDDPRFGLDDTEPVSFTVDARVYTKTQSFPPSTATVTSATWSAPHPDAVDQVYPWVLGQAGVHSSDDAIPGSRARTVLWTAVPEDIPDVHLVMWDVRDPDGVSIVFDINNDDLEYGSTVDGVLVREGMRVLHRYHDITATAKPLGQWSAGTGFRLAHGIYEATVSTSLVNQKKKVVFQRVAELQRVQDGLDLQDKTVRVLEGAAHGGYRFALDFADNGDPVTRSLWRGPLTVLATATQRWTLSTGHGARKLVICGDQVDTDTATVRVQVDATVELSAFTVALGYVDLPVQHEADGLGRTVAVVDLEALQFLDGTAGNRQPSSNGIGPVLFAELLENRGFVSWTSGVGVAGVRTVADGVRYLLPYTGIPLAPELAGQLAQLPPFLLGMDVDDFAPAVDLLQGRLLPLVRAGLQLGANGLALSRLQLDGPVMLTLDTSRNCTRVGQLRERYPDGDQKVAVLVRYAHDRSASSRWVGSTSRGAPGEVRAQATLADLTAQRAWTFDPGPSTEVLDLEDIWDDWTAEQLAVRELDFAGVVTVASVIADDIPHRQALQLAGQRVRLVDGTLDRVGYIARVLVTLDGVGLELALQEG